MCQKLCNHSYRRPAFMSNNVVLLPDSIVDVRLVLKSAGPHDRQHQSLALTYSTTSSTLENKL